MSKKGRGAAKAVTRKKVRDGIIVSEQVTVAIAGIEAADALEAFEIVPAFAPIERIIGGYAERARRAIGDGAEGARLANAENAIWQAGQVLRFLDMNKPSAAVRHTVWMMQSLWRVDMKEVEPIVITGAKVRKPFDEANKGRGNASRARVSEWQRRANEKWADPQHAGKKVSEIARLIAQPDENPATIRRRIKKLS